MQSDEVPRRATDIRVAQRQEESSTPHGLAHLSSLTTTATALLTARKSVDERFDEVLAGQDSLRLLDQIEEQLSSFEVDREPGELLLPLVHPGRLLEVLLTQVSAKGGTEGVNVVEDAFLQLRRTELLQILPGHDEAISWTNERGRISARTQLV